MAFDSSIQVHGDDFFRGTYKCPECKIQKIGAFTHDYRLPPRCQKVTWVGVCGHKDVVWWGHETCEHKDEWWAKLGIKYRKAGIWD